MKIISEAQRNVLSILGKGKRSDGGYRLMKYCAQEAVEDGILLFNLLTRELLLLTNEEYADLTSLEYLKDHWFIVPEALSEKKNADMVKWVLRSTAKRSEAITTYTIMPTSDCNARCFYCLEKGQPRIPMSEETARKTAEYIKDHCGGKKVLLLWFGGEPLYNMPVMDVISEELQKHGVAFSSHVTTNGYLFDDAAVKKATDNWNVKTVQITLDGTEQVYNRSKAYIYRDGSPYQVVLRNVERLLDAKISVFLRLNIDLYNADDLMKLADELALRFAGRTGLNVYAHHIFDVDTPMSDMHTDEAWEKRYEAMCRLEDKLYELKLLQRGGIRKKPKLHNCMADSGNSVVIVPTGDIGLCENYISSELIGSIDWEGFDANMLGSWKEQMPELPECAECFYYPDCIRLKKCTTSRYCYPQKIKEHLRTTKRCMLYEYEQWRNGAATSDAEDTVSC